ncbi:mariner transposase [Trichonephila clavipes]|nr:mariner transposase [Trichonephila clavipes]
MKEVVEENSSSPDNRLTISGDGTWKTSGHSSLIGVCTVIGAETVCESLTKRNEIDPSLKRMVTEDETWVTYDNIVQKRSWSKLGEAAQTMAKPGLIARNVLLCIW